MFPINYQKFYEDGILKKKKDLRFYSLKWFVCDLGFMKDEV